MGTTPGRCKSTAATAFLFALTSACGSACGSGAAEGPPAAADSPATTADPPATEDTTMTATTTEQGDPVGRVDRETIEAQVPAWRTARESASPDPEASRQLAEVAPGARVDVYLGTWCGDSRREVPRLWSAFDLAGELPFEVTYVAVDRAKDAPGGLLDDVDIEYVPTFVVIRDGEEVGRIVESAPGGIENDLLALLRGERTGVISGRTDL